MRSGDGNDPNEIAVTSVIDDWIQEERKKPIDEGVKTSLGQKFESMIVNYDNKREGMKWSAPSWEW